MAIQNPREQSASENRLGFIATSPNQSVERSDACDFPCMDAAVWRSQSRGNLTKITESLPVNLWESAGPAYNLPIVRRNRQIALPVSPQISRFEWNFVGIPVLATSNLWMASGGIPMVFGRRVYGSVSRRRFRDDFDGWMRRNYESSGKREADL